MKAETKTGASLMLPNNFFRFIFPPIFHKLYHLVVCGVCGEYIEDCEDNVFELSNIS